MNNLGESLVLPLRSQLFTFSNPTANTQSFHCLKSRARSVSLVACYTDNSSVAPFSKLSERHQFGINPRCIWVSSQLSLGKLSCSPVTLRFPWSYQGCTCKMPALPRSLKESYLQVATLHTGALHAKLRVNFEDMKGISTKAVVRDPSFLSSHPFYLPHIKISIFELLLKPSYEH